MNIINLVVLDIRIEITFFFSLYYIKIHLIKYNIINNNNVLKR